MNSDEPRSPRVIIGQFRVSRAFGRNPDPLQLLEELKGSAAAASHVERISVATYLYWDVLTVNVVDIEHTLQLSRGSLWKLVPRQLGPTIEACAECGAGVRARIRSQLHSHETSRKVRLGRLLYCPTCASSAERRQWGEAWSRERETGKVTTREGGPPGPCDECGADETEPYLRADLWHRQWQRRLEDANTPRCEPCAARDIGAGELVVPDTPADSGPGTSPPPPEPGLAGPTPVDDPNERPLERPVKTHRTDREGTE